MFWNRWSIVVLLLEPLLVIALVSSAFTELMKSYEEVGEFKAGYRMEESMEVFAEAMKDAGKEAGILFYEYPEGEIQRLMEKNELAAFVEFSKDQYTIYSSEDHPSEGMTLEYFVNKMMRTEITDTLSQKEASAPVLTTEKLEALPPVDAVDYYGFIEILYFSWCGIICATGILSNEKKYGIRKKFQIAGISETRVFLGKLIPTILVVSAGMGLTSIVTVFLFDIQWGNPLLSALVVFAMIVAATSYGMMLYQITEHLVVTIIVLFTSVWFFGFFGGSFETYMFSSVSDTLKQLSPLYHGNRALVELSAMGKSSYVESALIYSLIIAVICSGIGIFAGYIRKRGKA